MISFKGCDLDYAVGDTYDAYLSSCIMHREGVLDSAVEQATYVVATYTMYLSLEYRFLYGGI